MSETIEIQMNTTYAGPLGVFPGGTVWACPREEAKALIEGNYAVQVESETAEPAPVEGTETTETTEAVNAGAETTERVRGFIKPKGK